MSDKSPGQFAYEAFIEALPEERAPWTALSEVAQKAWEYSAKTIAAAAALDSDFARQCLTDDGRAEDFYSRLPGHDTSSAGSFRRFWRPRAK